MTVREALSDAEVMEAWNALMASNANPERLTQSPSWVRATESLSSRSEYHVAVVEGDGGIVGVVSLRRHELSLRVRAKSAVLLQTPVAVVSLLGSSPLLAADGEAYRALCAAIHLHFPRCGLYFRNLPRGSSLIAHLGAFAKGKWLTHSIEGEQRHHLLRLPRTFDQFLAQRSSRTRNTLRRKLRAFAETGGDAGALTRVDRPEQVSSFLEVAAMVSRRSWQHRRLGTRIHANAREHARLSGLARQGLFRSYLLHLGTEPCAFVMGYQYDGAFHLDELGYAEEFSALSPGTVLLVRVIEDLISEGNTAVINFGDGDAEYKRGFSTDTYIEERILLLPRTSCNRMLVGTHRLFRLARDRLKSWHNGLRPLVVRFGWAGASAVEFIDLAPY